MIGRRNRPPDPVALLRRLVRRCGCPKETREQYVRFGMELLHVMHRPPVPDYPRAAKLVVMKWFRRGLSGRMLAIIGHAVTAARFGGGRGKA